MIQCAISECGGASRCPGDSLLILVYKALKIQARVSVVDAILVGKLAVADSTCHQKN